MNPQTIDTLIIGAHTQGLVKRRATALLSAWQMQPAERVMLLTLLRELTPDVALEIGTWKGGSLAVLADYAKTVYSLDINTDTERNLGKYFKNVRFLCGDSAKNTGVALEQIKKQKRHLQFVLIDGDHSREGVRRDVEAVLKYRPTKPMVILMHDTFHPPCRYGILDANWSANPYVHSLNMDFVPGVAHRFDHGQEMWSGFGAAFLLPTPRKGKLVIQEPGRWLFDEVWPRTSHAKIHFGAPIVAGNTSAGAAQTQTVENGYYNFFANRPEHEMKSYLAAGPSKSLPKEPEGFVEIRKRLAPMIQKWRDNGMQVAVYGAGKHTLALMGLIPELHPLVSCFIDKNISGKYLGKPCVTPQKFNEKNADAVVYSSKASQNEMYKSFAHHKVEHVKLYS